ncbi:hypothetical protein DE146DRAFT_110285 [Phaeosphaeria sp. MPI-PUGE-AT-0046c]|nr:hypothetical protein DE146DRAFT_110285 [Phaeosphaeria sp. MPI-PUGE-AT-0046c]
MASSTSPTVMNKPHPIITGTKIIRFTIPSTCRRFTVHEDLVCLTSKLFSSTLQANRKSLSPSSTCSICYDMLDPIVEDIAFCAACGQNIHAGCIERWKQRQRVGDAEKDTLPTCPMCRATWKEEPLLKSRSVREEVDAGAVQMYIDWLYTRTLRVPAGTSRNSDAFNVALLKCWAVAAAMRDEVFKNAVVGTFFDEAKARFWSDSVKWTFVEDCKVKEIKDFVMEVFLAFMEPGWFREESARWPEVFVREVGESLLEDGRMKGYEEIKSRWLEKLGSDQEGGSKETMVGVDDRDIERLVAGSTRGRGKRSADEGKGPRMKRIKWACMKDA